VNDKDRLKQVNKAHPCPVCGRGDTSCARGSRLVLCRKVQGPHPHFEYKGQSKKDDQWAIYLYPKDDAPLQPGSYAANGQAIDWQARAEQYVKALTPAARRQLAEHLGLPEAVLASHGIGYLTNGPRGPSWTLPEHDGAGHIIGIGLRAADGSKGFVPGGHRGLFLPSGWEKHNGPVFCPEGPSDTLALTALGLSAVGRPSNLGGIEYLAALFQGLPKDRPIVIVAEWDAKDNGAWPGREGAERVARQLAEKLNRPVSWILPPKGHKDIRAWVLAQNLDPTIADAWDDAAERMLAAWASKYQVISPTAGTEPAATEAEPLTVRPHEPGSPEPAAYHGLAGQLVQLIEPHSEADPVALLVQILVAFGNCIGRTAHFVVEGDTHFLKLFVVLVGMSSKGRKGSSWGHVQQFFASLDADWQRQRIKGGLSSGEGLIWQVRDAILKQEPVKEKGSVVAYKEVEADPGVHDKRLLCYEPEFASVLKVLERQGNTLSTLIRQAWDAGDLRSLTKNSLAQATGTHISILGHVTPEDVRRYLSATEQANGFGNRFLWIAVKRSKVLPEGGHLDPHDLDALREQFRGALNFARSLTEPMGFDADARAAWYAVYPTLSEGRPGLAGSMCARAEAQVRRLACLYALLGLSSVVRSAHLQAALALWKYADDTVRFVFGDSLGDPVADDILLALQAAPEGLTRDKIRDDVFGKHKGAASITRALGLLHALKLAHGKKVPTGGRPEERWFAGPEKPGGKEGKAG
jgi:hypothetical protein